MKEGFDKIQLKDACSVFADGDWIERKDQSNEGIRLVQTGNIGFGFFKDKKDKSRYISEETFNRLNCTEIVPGDLLVSRLPDPVGKSCIIPEINSKMITGVDCTIIRPKDNLSSEFLGYYQMSHQYLKDVQANVSGATRQRISRKKLGLIEIPLPPLPQQKQIVAILDKAFAAIDTAKANAEQNLQNAKELFESYLQNIFKNKRDDWEEKKLGEVCDLIKRGSQPEYTENKDGEIVLNQKCIRDHKINYSHSRRHDLSIKSINEERYIQLGDGLINSTGTGTLGRVAQVRDLNQRAFVDTHITIVRPKKELFYLDFFGWALIYIEKIIEKSGEGASGQTELSRKLVEKFVVSFPKKMEQQKQIVLKLDSLSEKTKKLEAIYTQKIADLEEMKKSVLQKAFSGQLNTIN
jgi:type I restriction enzyme, S subunit